MRKIILAALIVGIISPSLSFADGSTFYNSKRYAQVNRKWSFNTFGWRTDTDGHFRIVDNATNRRGQKIDIKKDTSKVDKEKTFGINLAYEATKRISVEFNMLSVKNEGNTSVNRVFKGQNYAAGSRFKVKDNVYDFLMNYRLWHTMCKDGRERNHISGIFGVKVSDMDFGINGNVENILRTNNYSKSLYVPYFGLEFGTFIGKMMYFKASVRAIDVDINDYKSGHCDYNLVLSHRLSSDDSLHDILMDIGYRSISFDFEGKAKNLGNDIELEYSGPYIGFDLLF